MNIKSTILSRKEYIVFTVLLSVFLIISLTLLLKSVFNKNKLQVGNDIQQTSPQVRDSNSVSSVDMNGVQQIDQQVYDSNKLNSNGTLTITPQVSDSNSVSNVDMVALGDKNQSVPSLANYQPQNTIDGDGAKNNPYQVADSKDSVWENFQPQNLTYKLDSTTNKLIVAWKDNQKDISPYMWLVGYWYERFNASEKFNIQNLTSEQMVMWNQAVNSDLKNNPSQKQLLMNIEDFNLFSDKVYFYIYIRTNIGNKYIDYLYGQDITNNIPYTYNLKL